jgi:hypothetical protein
MQSGCCDMVVRKSCRLQDRWLEVRSRGYISWEASRHTVLAIVLYSTIVSWLTIAA